jgi:hypothetical protein
VNRNGCISTKGGAISGMSLARVHSSDPQVGRRHSREKRNIRQETDHMVVALVLLGTLSGYMVGGLVLWSTGSLSSGILAGVVTGFSVTLVAAVARALCAGRRAAKEPDCPVQSVPTQIH